MCDLSSARSRQAAIYQEDSAEIVRVFADRGLSITADHAMLAWDSYSDSMAAGWLGLGDDETTFEIVRQHLRILQIEPGSLRQPA